jgi:hypothetical protein
MIDERKRFVLLVSYPTPGSGKNRVEALGPWDNVETARHRGQQATRAGLRAVVVNLGRWPGINNLTAEVVHARRTT